MQWVKPKSQMAISHCNDKIHSKTSSLCLSLCLSVCLLSVCPPSSLSLSLSLSLAVFCHNPSYVTASRCARSFRLKELSE